MNQPDIIHFMSLENKIATYQMPQETRDLVRSTPLLLIAGVVSAGKDTTVRELIKDERFYNIISQTTRAPRENHGILEVNHQDYHFITLEEAAGMVNENAFVEVKYVHGNVYGTSAQEIKNAADSGKTALNDIDIEGVIEYLSVKPDTYAIFLLPPSVDTWMKRLEKRYGDVSAHTEEIAKRFRTAYDEIIKARSDERFILVINDDLETTVKRILEIIDGREDKTSEYALSVTDHLLDFLKTKI